MKRITLGLSLIMAVMTACAAPSVENSVPKAGSSQEDSSMPATQEPAPTSAPTEAVGTPKLPAAAFESQTYVNQQVGFALDYPA